MSHNSTGPQAQTTHSSTPCIATVILHYGDPLMTARLHDQLNKSDPSLIDSILVLDNNAPDPYPRSWLRLDRNLYWPGALEHVRHLIAAQGYSHLWFLNNDLTFDVNPPIISRVAARLGRMNKTMGPVGIYSPCALRNPYHPQMIQNSSIQARSVQYVDGIAPLFSLECLDVIGGVDYEGNPFGYGVDIFMSQAAIKAGFNVMVDHQICIRHAYHSTARKIDGFLNKAAMAEDQYLSNRFGPDHQKMIKTLSRKWQDFSRI